MIPEQPQKDAWPKKGRPRLSAWWDIVQQMWTSSYSHNILGHAAQLGFYFLLAVFPALLCLTTIVGMLPLEEILPQLIGYFQKVMPRESLVLVERYLREISQGVGSDVFSLSLVGAVFASSWSMMAIIECLNTVYGVKETRPLWALGITALLLTLGATVFVIVSIVLILIGENLGQWIADLVGLSELFTLAWSIFQWPVIILLMLLATSLIYYWAPNSPHSWRGMTPGSILAVSLWILVSLAFRVYVESLAYYNLVYGSIAGVIFLMIWFYLSGLVLLLGGELNAILENQKRETR